MAIPATIPTQARSVSTPAWSWLADAWDVEHAFQAQRSMDGISWSPACGATGEIRGDRVRQVGQRRVCVACCARMTRDRVAQPR